MRRSETLACLCIYGDLLTLIAEWQLALAMVKLFNKVCNADVMIPGMSTNKSLPPTVHERATIFSANLCNAEQLLRPNFSTVRL